MVDIVNRVDDEQPLQESESNDVIDSQKETELKSVILDIIFDGTGNNLFNTDHQTEDEKKVNEEYQRRNYPKNLSSEEVEKIKDEIRKEVAPYGHLKGQISYDNDYSNIVHLYKASTINATKKSIYIQGAGTIKNTEDSTIGLAAAWGESGILSRVKDAFFQTQIKARLMKAGQIVFNVYGFSHSDFYGRYFCAMIPEEIGFYDTSSITQKIAADERYDEMKKCGRNLLTLNPYFMSINFVGIYDTVTSEGSSPNNDAIPFRQDIGAKQRIKKIFHLTAQDEFRNHFPLAEINTAITQKNGEGHYIGFECSIPGAHADVGGGYTKPWAEEDRYLSLFDKPNLYAQGYDAEIHWSWFNDKGFYTSNGTLPERKAGFYGEYEVTQAFGDESGED